MNPELLKLAPFLIPLFLFCFAFHEMAHAFSAHFFGDRTPQEHGRITLNPIKHLDPLGSIMIIVSFLLFGFPFGFAVTPINESRMRKPRLHGALVSLAGPMSNLLLLVLSLIALTFAVRGDVNPTLVTVLFYAMSFNALLVVFNLLPIPPLDGAHILGSFMDPYTARRWRAVDEYGIFIILGMVFLLQGQFQVFIGDLQGGLISVTGELIGKTLPSITRA